MKVFSTNEIHIYGMEQLSFLGCYTKSSEVTRCAFLLVALFYSLRCFFYSLRYFLLVAIFYSLLFFTRCTRFFTRCVFFTRFFYSLHLVCFGLFCFVVLVFFIRCNGLFVAFD